MKNEEIPLFNGIIVFWIQKLSFDPYKFTISVQNLEEVQKSRRML